MRDLTIISPLMCLIHYHGQDYYTAQYFHRAYLANSQRQAQRGIVGIKTLCAQ